MAAYFMVQSTITDEAQYQKYRAAVVPFISTFGGKIAARGAEVEILEGEHNSRPRSAANNAHQGRGAAAGGQLRQAAGAVAETVGALH